MSLLRIASDLHLEFFRDEMPRLVEHFLPPDERDASAVLVLAGDISSRPGQLLDFLAAVEERFAAVIYVPGNHEYYGHDYHEWNRACDGWGKGLKRTLLAGGQTITKDLGGFRFIASTLWGDGGQSDEERNDLQRGLADFRVIRWASRRFTPKDMADLSRQHLSNIAASLRDPGRDGRPAVVVTHHLPSFSLCHPRFGARINAGFATGCDNLMRGDDAPMLWIHGHTHDTMDTVVGRTRVVCNPAGYQPEWGTAHNSFSPKFIELALDPEPAALSAA